MINSRWYLEKRNAYPDDSSYGVWTRWKPRLPRIGTEVLDCSVYLYANEEDARLGVRFGGSGFLLGVPRGWEEPLSVQTARQRFSATATGQPWGVHRELGSGFHLYAVTNRHIVTGGCLTARINKRAGGTKILPLLKKHWHVHPDFDEVAVCPVSLDRQRDRYRKVHVDQLISRKLMEDLGVGPGDGIFTIGRFVNHAGVQQNRPAVRYGSLSVMPEEPIRSRAPGGLDIELEGYLVESRSQSGFSGSPAFLHFPEYELLRPPKEARREEPTRALRRRLFEEKGQDLWLLGICWGHFPDETRAKEVDEHGRTVREFKVELNSGLMCVAPAWKILEVLNLPELKEQRRAECEAYDSEGRAVTD